MQCCTAVGQSSRWSVQCKGLAQHEWLCLDFILVHGHASFVLREREREAERHSGEKTVPSASLCLPAASERKKTLVHMHNHLTIYHFPQSSDVFLMIAVSIKINSGKNNMSLATTKLCVNKLNWLTHVL